MIVRHLRRIADRAVWSWAGWVHVWRTEGSLHQWIWANVVSAALAFALPLSGAERAVLLMGGILVLAFECLNTAIERVVDDISTEKRDRARQAKDAGSAAVSVAGIAVGVAWVVILVSRFALGGG
ncbi:Diacylglycerol kinase [Flavimaricola marinus]|uniref:Diacylglycerol kinase n=2 Tax=Flavimaricola marinus TaxID=1819565 RepID=A0A238LGF2_9RHOB|nr:Diacylglycerol kinase [Flavimaricola marinus]